MIPPPVRCSFNFPGHHPHRGRVNLFLGRQVTASGEVSELEQVHRTGVRLHMVGGGEHIYRNHQPERIVAAFGGRDGPALLYVTDGLMTVPEEKSTYFFSLAREEFRTCREHRKSIEGFLRASRGLTDRHAMVAYRLRGPFLPDKDTKSDRDFERPRSRPNETPSGHGRP